MGKENLIRVQKPLQDISKMKERLLHMRQYRQWCLKLTKESSELDITELLFS
jgi:biotin synthase-related radical SAM superfamily protein